MLVFFFYFILYFLFFSPLNDLLSRNLSIITIYSPIPTSIIILFIRPCLIIYEEIKKFRYKVSQVSVHLLLSLFLFLMSLKPNPFVNSDRQLFNIIVVSRLLFVSSIKTMQSQSLIIFLLSLFNRTFMFFFSFF